MMQWIERQQLPKHHPGRGGTFLFRRAVKEAFPKHKIHEIKEPMYANVKGFQIAGMNYSRSTLKRELPGDNSGRPVGETA